MEHQELVKYLANTGKDPSRLIFEDELTGLYNRRYLYHLLNTQVAWDQLNRNPLSLLMMDLDYFKQINDNYGHQAGDQALIWLSGHLREVAGTTGMPIRYAGDEFMILLRNTDKKSSLLMGEQLLQNIRKKPFKPNEQTDQISLTLSVGVASAPDDARNSRALIRQADTALYSAKRNGRDQMANAGEVKPTDVFAKTVIYQLNDVQIVGRGRQLSVVAEGLKKFSLRQSQFLIATGAAGMGKSDFLETIRRNLARSKTWQSMVSGAPQEMYRPYYLMEKILVDILNHREDKGADILKKMSPVEQVYLSRALPLVGVDNNLIKDKDERTQREEFFDTLLQFIPKLVDYNPLILFIDDLHFGDEATLMLIRRLMLRSDFPLLVCATATKTHNAGDDRPVALEHFCEMYQEDLGIRKIVLAPLVAADITRHMQDLFPNIHIPKGIDEELIRVTQGNPLFLNEILRKLVSDHKITLTGKQWLFQALEEGYLPKSLEEIVTDKIAALDEESRQMLDQVSALGEDVSLSMLIGSSDQMEARVLDFVDKATAQGLLNSEFQVNDEIIGFLGKRILDITYNAIEPDRKEQLHERIGNYQESLFQQRLLPSAATLAYHFKRSTDQQKAGTYEQVLATSNDQNYNAEEATFYTGENLAEDVGTDVPIQPPDVALIPKVIRDFMVAIRNIKLYPPGSKSITGVIGQSKASLDQILANNKTLNLMQIKQGLVVNGRKMDITDFRLVAERFLQFLARYELKGISFHSGLTDIELEVMIETFGRTREKMFDDRYWQRFSVENSLKHIELKQIRYTMSGKPQTVAGKRIPGRGAKALSVAQPGGIERQGETLIAAILKGLLGAVKIGRLYPLDSKAVVSAVDQLLARLNIILTKTGSLTISHAGNTLLINGDREDVSEYKTFANNFIKFLNTIGLKSLAFVQGLKRQELETFIGTLVTIPAEGVESRFWQDFAQNKKLTGIVFDKHVYEIKVAQTSKTVAGGTGGVVAIPTFVDAPVDEPIPDVDFDAFLSAFPDLVQELFDQGLEAKAKQAVAQLYAGLADRDFPIRERVVNTCRHLLESLQPAFQHNFAKYLADPLLNTFGQEQDPKLIVELAAFLNRLVTSLIGFVDYSPAARIITQLQQRYEALTGLDDPNLQRLSKSLSIRLNPTTQKLLAADLKSGEASRQNNAVRLLESLGQTSLPLLINIVKQEDDFRARQSAATIIAKQGSQAASRLKNLLVLEITPEERVRVLDIIDTVTSDLITELLHALGDENRDVRLAAFRLSERLQDHRVVGMLLENARTAKSELAVAAVNSLEKLKPPEAVEVLAEIMQSTKKEALRIACCRALGQIAKPECIDPLSIILNKKSVLLRRYIYSDRMRATAAFALGQIRQARAVKTLAAYVNDPDQRIREVARTVLRKVKAATRRRKTAPAAAKS